MSFLFVLFMDNVFVLVATIGFIPW